MNNPNLRWSPTSGRETDALLTAKFPSDKSSRKLLESEAIDILEHCPAPGELNRRETGLAVGYVQSGKTQSYITLSSLARENGYAIVVVVTGMSVPLFEQSTRDIKTALQAAGKRSWLFLENPGLEDLAVLQSTLESSRHHDPRLPRQTAMLTVMKHAKRIQNVADLLGQIEMAGITALVIDDEADQASLNTKVRQDEISATYRSVASMRAALPSHAYVQYTATPQAVLLISIIDQLSPSFVKVLTPGSGYVGGPDFFGKDPRFVADIPAAEIPGPHNPLAGPPNSLKDALAMFFIGVADAYEREETMNDDNRSMMIHPSRLVEDHADYYEWVTDLKEDWVRILGTGSSRERELLLKRFRLAHANITLTREGLAPFDALMKSMSFAIAQTLIHRVNAANGPTPFITWENRYAHILVGGQAMDRGFVVRGLTVTYMPRNTGVGNADTTQQRARFFGYKANIKGYCRVFLEATIAAALKDYVHHEEDIRASLKELERTGTSVTDWRRRFVLSHVMHLTRSNIYKKEVIRVTSVTSGWVWPRFAYITEATVNDNKLSVEAFLKQYTATGQFYGHMKYDGLSLRELHDELVAEYRTATPNDSVKFAAAREHFEFLIQMNPDAVGDVFYMQNREFRAATEAGGIDQIFQGRGRTTDYPGDRKILTADRVTIQIHVVDIQMNHEAVARAVPVLAIRFPERSENDTILQPGNVKP